jgi:uncharacterized membrane protein YfcA
MDFRASLAGLLVGTVAGMSGIGGSALLAPLLILVLGVEPVIAVGTDLVYSVPMKLIAAAGHLRQGTVDRSVVRWLGAGGVPGTLAGLAAFWLLRVRVGGTRLDQLERHAIGVLILCAALAALILMLTRHERAPSARRANAWLITAIGALVGFLVAMTSIGSGSITLPLLLLALPAAGLRPLIGSEIVLGALIVPIAALGHISFATVDWHLAVALALGAVPGAVLGVWLCGFLSVGVLRPVVMCVLAYAGFKLL